MSKKADFLSGLSSVQEREGVQRYPRPTAPPPPKEEPPSAAPTASPPPKRVPNRAGKVAVTQWVDPLVRKQIALIALDTDRYEVVNEALNLLFEKYGKPPIA
jgi:hypothetical protein